MSTKLKLRVGKKPDPAAAISTTEIRANKRLIRQVFGTATPRLAIILPGSYTTEIEVRMANADDDDLMALARAVGVTGKGGDRA
ncbi:hypothetical protein FYJ43_04635 [Cutibacterium sp. WCA-380-WT-3A]|uniref:Uncharacterized protein n=1 Tax=Cutibacterium porci TaxID=2605781 RepID=A0A7K0J5Y1_9ACTN|nr:hypothetical protein [Cutibacterium porci]MSS45339.1 hypothetical protein [Cutibacterium porci]